MTEAMFVTYPSPALVAAEAERVLDDMNATANEHRLAHLIKHVCHMLDVQEQRLSVVQKVAALASERADAK